MMASNVDQDHLKKESDIQFLLEAFETYIIGCLKGDCVKVILSYRELSHDQKRKLISYHESKNELPEKVLSRFFKEIRQLPNNNTRYKALLDAVKDNQKVLFILTGRAIPTGDLGRTVLFRTATEICDMLNVEEILPSLLAKDVITDRDSQTIRARHKSEGNWRAAVKLLDCLPNKHPHWFKQLLAALEESKHDRLAQLLTLKEIEEVKGTSTACGERRVLQSLDMLPSRNSDYIENKELPRTHRDLRPDRQYHSLGVRPSRAFSDVAVVRGSRSERAMPTSGLEKHLGGLRIEEKSGDSKNTIDAIYLKRKLAELQKKMKQNGENTVQYTSLPDRRPPTVIYDRCGSSSFRPDEWLTEQNIGQSWWPVFRREIEKSYFQKLWKFVEKDRHLYGPAVSPRSEKVFCWTKYCTLEEVKVVIIAENPTNGYYSGSGLAFGLKRGQPMSSSLRNIYKEIQHDIQGFSPPKHGNLKGWAKQGVLLLNSVLTWRAEHGQAKNLHKDQGWEVFTDEILSYLNHHTKHPLVFMLWGKKAQEKGSLINGKIHWVLEAAHPSSLSASKGFFGCKHFSKCNNILVKQGQKPIDWSYLPE